MIGCLVSHDRQFFPIPRFAGNKRWQPTVVRSTCLAFRSSGRVIFGSSSAGARKSKARLGGLGSVRTDLAQGPLLVQKSAGQGTSLEVACSILNQKEIASGNF